MSNESSNPWDSEIPVIDHQDSTIIYLNRAGGITIRQQSPDEDDAVIAIPAQCINAVLDRLQALKSQL